MGKYGELDKKLYNMQEEHEVGLEIIYLYLDILCFTNMYILEILNIKTLRQQAVSYLRGLLCVGGRRGKVGDGVPLCVLVHGCPVQDQLPPSSPCPSCPTLQQRSLGSSLSYSSEGPSSFLGKFITSSYWWGGSVEEGGIITVVTLYDGFVVISKRDEEDCGFPFNIGLALWPKFEESCNT